MSHSVACGSHRPLSPERLRLLVLEDRTTPTFFNPVYNTEHVDLRFDYVGGSWALQSYNGDTNALSPAGKALHYAAPAAKVIRPSDAKWNFLGVSAGAPVYVLPQTQNPALLYLGASAEGTAPSSLKAWLPSDPRVSATTEWIRVDVVGFRGPGQMSVYDVDSGGNPRVWIATADGLSVQDLLFVPAGGHLHFNWAFTARGVYELDVHATAYLGPGQTNPTTSGVATYFFSVDPPPPSQTLPATQTTFLNTPMAFSAANNNAITVSAITTSPAPLQVRLDALGGVLYLGENTSGVHIKAGAEGSNSLTIEGKDHQINTALNGLVFKPDPGFSGTARLTVTTDDQGAYKPAPNNVQSVVGEVTINVNGIAPPGFVPPGVRPLPTDPPGDGGSNGGGIGGGGMPPGGGGTGGMPLPPPPSNAPILLNTSRIVVLANDAGAEPRVRVFDAQTGAEYYNFLAYERTFRGGVQVAVGDVNGDGIPDIVTAAGNGGGPLVKIFDGKTGTLLRAFFAYNPSFRGGVQVALGDVNRDEVPDLVVGTGSGGGPHVRLFDGRTGADLGSFFAFDPAFRGGVNVALGDLDGDGYADVIAGAGVGGGPHVRVFSGRNGQLIGNFLAYDPNFRGGVHVAVGDVHADGKLDLITGAGPGGGPHVRIFAHGTLAPLTSFFAFTPEDNVGKAAMDVAWYTGVRVAAVDRLGTGRTSVLTAKASGKSSLIGFYNVLTGMEERSFGSLAEDTLVGVYVGGSW